MFFIPTQFGDNTFYLSWGQIMVPFHFLYILKNYKNTPSPKSPISIFAACIFALSDLTI